MRRGVRFPACYLLLVAVLEILSCCLSLRDQAALCHLHPRRAYVNAELGAEPPTILIPRFVTSSTRLMWHHCALQSVTGRLPRSQVGKPISISWCVKARRCGARSRPPPVAVRLHYPGGALLDSPGSGVLLRRILRATARSATPLVRTMSGQCCGTPWRA